MQLDVLLPVTALALLDTLSPATIGVTLVLLLSGRARIAFPLLAYLATVAVCYLALGIALMSGLDLVVTRLGPVADHRAVLWLQAVLGIALLTHSCVKPTQRRDAPARWESRELHIPIMVSLGLGTFLLEGATVLPYLAAVGIMTAAGLSPLQWLPLLAGYVTIMLLPPIVMYLGHRLLGSRLRPRMERWRHQLSEGAMEGLAWLVGIAGFLLLANAVNRLGLLDGSLGLPFE
ncbi:GAP family protein [Lipingzhangella sp. LS1_29]|uniref:GAP family protein n=1 Tax=Lipingzhangella rawalii TaxID=2055835 RepID=A0ABU2H5M6_9ACTN|nr:GAP family protein [Lipingzhangella rawalii]MDS1270611.1 GAP family protein [Lipingzhangella rawalii]